MFRCCVRVFRRIDVRVSRAKTVDTTPMIMFFRGEASSKFRGKQLLFARVFFQTPTKLLIWSKSTTAVRMLRADLVDTAP